MIVGIDIGGTKCAVTYAKNPLEIINKVSFKTLSCKNTLEKIIDIIHNLEDIEAIGISCGGPLDEEKGIIMSPPNLPKWDNIKIVDILKEEFNVPTFIRNDANACALAEWMYGSGKGYNNAIFLTFGTGMGSGLILNGKLYSGTNGNAGEIGHIRMTNSGPMGFNKAGSFEGYYSGNGIKQLGISIAKKEFSKGYKAPYELEDIDAKLLSEYARKNEKVAKLTFKTSAKYLGKGLSILIDILNPEVIIIGSIYSRCEDLFQEELNKELKKESLCESLNVCKIVKASLGESVGDIAALSVAVEGLNRSK